MTDRARKAETSSAESELTRHDSRDDEDISSSGFQMGESNSTEWTNEKHSSYLNSMEASFVKQLYNDEYDSFDLLGWRSRRKNLPHENANTGTASSQFKILESGCWKTIDFKRAPHKLNGVENSHALRENPWIQPMEKKQEVAPSGLGNSGRLCCEAISLRWHPTSSNKIPSLEFGACDDSILNYEEVSDQNFVVEENKPEQLSSPPQTKRMKTMDADLSTKDQVVPNGKSALL